MNTELVKETLLLESYSKEYKRLFHGRGGCYKGFEFLSIDSIDTLLYVVFFDKIEESLEKSLFKLFETILKRNHFSTLVLQRRYLSKAPNEILIGELPKEINACENGLKYKLNFLSNQNIGFFPDMKNGRVFVRNQAKNKNVLNLFSYTCAFSIVAKEAGALKVVNVDMAKGALTTGRQNHHLNHQDTKNIRFMPYNILKSWNRIKKEGPYDLIIIDPPSFQKGSFAATKDYRKIIKRLNELASKECTILSSLNAPELDTGFIKELFEEFAPSFYYVQRLENLESFPALDEEKSLKNLVFRNY